MAIGIAPPFEPNCTGRWYFETVEERDAYMRQRLDLALAAGANYGVISTLRRYFKS